MAITKFTGTGKVVTADFKDVKFTGRTKAGADIEITVKNAINVGNIAWAFAGKNDVVDSIKFEGTYDNTDDQSNTTEEPWEVIIDSVSTKASENIMLGSGKLSIGSKTIGLVRGGGTFEVAREFREINVDGDRGMVKDRVDMEGSRPSITVNVLEIINNMADLYPGITKTTT